MGIVLFICADPALALANNVNCPPAIEDMALSLTSYWFFGPDGEPVAWNGQADGNPEGYANSYPTSPDHAWRVSACISEWTTLYWTTAVSFMWGSQIREVACYDNFGLESYREPFFHDGYGQWVIPVDVLTPEVVHGLVHDWSTTTVQVGAVDW